MDYMEDSKMEVLNYLRKQKVDIAALDEAVIDEMAYRYYKNYYSYEMDHDFAVMDAVEELFYEVVRICTKNQGRWKRQQSHINTAEI